MLDYDDMYLGDTPLYRLYQGDELIWEYVNQNAEIEGTPPLYFIGYGTPFADYRIYGASGGVGDAVTGGRQIPVTLRNGTQTRSYTVSFEGDPLYERDYVSYSDRKVCRTISFWDGNVLVQGGVTTVPSGTSVGGTLIPTTNNARINCFGIELPFAGFAGNVYVSAETSRAGKTLYIETYPLTAENVRVSLGDGFYNSGIASVPEGAENLALVIAFQGGGAISPADITSITMVTEEAFPTSETVTAPKITPYNGVNTLSVETTVQPDNVWIKGKIREVVRNMAIYGDVQIIGVSGEIVNDAVNGEATESEGE